MVICIATFQYNNYGTRLQNYSLCQSLRKLGVEPVTLVPYTAKNNVKRVIKKMLVLLPAVSKRQKVWRDELVKETCFLRFNGSLTLKKIKYSELARCNEFDFAIAGSDQIWNPGHILRCPADIEFFFLRFIPKQKRFAYSVSFGVESIPDELAGNYKQYIGDFNLLSVREQAGQIIVKDFIEREVPIMPDPVFLLTKEEWIETAEESGVKYPSKKYLLTYFLSKQSNELWKRIYQFADKKDLEVVRITGNAYIKGETVPSPYEFVAWINGADMVFTDSFHGSIFSIIMKTPFLVFRRTDVDQFSRIETLLSKYNFTGAFYNSDKTFDTILTSEDFSQTEEIMDNEREKGWDFLIKIIDESRNDRRQIK